MCQQSQELFYYLQALFVSRYYCLGGNDVETNDRYLGPVYTAPGRSEKAAFFLRLGLLSALTCHQNGAFRQFSSMQRNLKRFLCLSVAMTTATPSTTPCKKKYLDFTLECRNCVYLFSTPNAPKSCSGLKCNDSVDVLR